jgi:hypothetical protein
MGVRHIVCSLVEPFVVLVESIVRGMVEVQGIGGRLRPGNARDTKYPSTWRNAIILER